MIMPQVEENEKQEGIYFFKDMQTHFVSYVIEIWSIGLIVVWVRRILPWNKKGHKITNPVRRT